MLEKARSLQDKIIHLRRTIHQNPELGFDVYKTAGLVSKTLRELGIEHATGVGKTGVVAHFGNGEGPVIGIRADMDALPILETNDVPYKSQIPGKMHACGHDAHTSILLGAAMLLKDEDFNGEIRLIFQPSEECADEEGISGAPRMIDDGALQGVDAAIALHVDGSTDVGSITVREGYATANADRLYAKIIGRGGHGAAPHNARDPIFMTAPILTALHGIASRWVDPTLPAVVTVGRLAGGMVANVIPREVELELTLRSTTDEVRAQLIEEVENALAISRNLGGDYKLHVERGYPSMYNDPDVTRLVQDIAGKMLGADHVTTGPLVMGAEDFAFMTRLAPGVMFALGTKAPGSPSRYVHTSNFDIDERALPIGAALLAQIALRYTKGGGTA